ncbi:peptidoglycan DD-metalloendopeptidase family protein [Spartinivicinus poritis]|uniref:Peptidoglycan DD-metalloendopeptidase family protein n=1 Tax=Spartinivicinus poritis TaxID=2994640 RepID=A0ABT5UA10_9GAMM|nr:peptidoglycan DD-metalloendopeptidase family protein [Spartinivicinus sp. A2-2]MDE1463192.1 peptidoglycan DD-metalloendopeptidase family protein [Spartinivicinus sp. A2-2]
MNKIDSARSKWQRFPKPHLAIASTVALGVALSLLNAPAEDEPQVGNNKKHTYSLTIDGNTTNEASPSIANSTEANTAKKGLTNTEVVQSSEKEQAPLISSEHSPVKTAVVKHNSIQQTPTNSSFTEGDDLPPTIDLTEPSDEPVKHLLAVSSVNTLEATQRSIAASQDSFAHSTKDKKLSYTVKKGESLSTIFKKQGFSSSTLYKIVSSSKEAKRLANIMPGQQLAFFVSPEGELKQVKYVRNNLESLIITKVDNTYQTQEIIRKPAIRQKILAGTINSSLFNASQRAGLPHRLTMQLANIFAWDIDFALDIRKGDHFKVIIEEKFLDGEKIGVGNILAAEFTNREETFKAIRYTDSDNHASYYTPDGLSMRKAFIRTPVAFSRISSRFNPGRRHPILNKIRSHKGVDYAAPTGTPIKASGDGKVYFAGRKGGYGRAVILQHGQRYKTLYGHMSRIKKGIRNGTRVKQGQVIGYVGQSGLATGPHLHYEFRVNGVHKNPLTVKFPKALPIAKKERSRFILVAQQMLAKLENGGAGSVIALKK